MNKQGGFATSGLAILGICLVLIGLLTNDMNEYLELFIQK